MAPRAPYVVGGALCQASCDAVSLQGRRWRPGAPAVPSALRAARRATGRRSGVAVDGHEEVGLGEQALQHVLDAGRRRRARAPTVGTADPDGGGAERERLDHVARRRARRSRTAPASSPAASTTPGRQSIAARHRWPGGRRGWSSRCRRRRRRSRAADVVGVADALEQQRQVGQRAQPGEVVPAQPRVAEKPSAHWMRRGAGSSSGGFSELRAEHRIARSSWPGSGPELRERGELQVARPPAEDPGVERDHDARGIRRPRRGGRSSRASSRSVGRVELEEARACRRARRRRPPSGPASASRRPSAPRSAPRRGRWPRSPCPSWAHNPITPIGARNSGVGSVRPNRLDRQVALGGAREHPRHEAAAIEGRDVELLRVLVARPAGDVRPCLGAHRRAGPLLHAGGRDRQLRAHAPEALEVQLELEVAVGHNASVWR